MQRNEAAASWGCSGSPKGDCGKPCCRLWGTSQTHIWRPSHSQLPPPGKPAHILLCPTSSLGCSGPHSRSPSGSEGEAGSSTCMNSRALPIPPHLLPPGPQQTVVNSPKGTRTSSAGGGAGSSSQHSGQGHFHTDVFCHKLGGVAKARVHRVPNDKPGKCVRASAQMGTRHFLLC